MIYRKATVAIPDANYLSSRAQNRGFCAFLGFGTLIFGLFEHKIGVFVLFWASEPSFSGFSSTKSGFLCFFGVWNPCFRGFRAQNQGFCALLESGTLVFGLFEHKIGVFVRLLWKHWLLETEKRANFLFCALLIYYSGVTAGAGYFTSS